MKQIFTVIIAAVLLAACKTLTPAEQEELARKVTQALNEKRYTIDVKVMYPRIGPSKNVTSDWSLEVRNDSLISYLPYIGRAYNIPYGANKGLNFTTTIDSYKESTTKNGMRRIEIAAKTDEDSYVYTIEVFDNGNATIDVLPKGVQAISFSGNLLVE